MSWRRCIAKHQTLPTVFMSTRSPMSSPGAIRTDPHIFVPPKKSCAWTLYPIQGSLSHIHLNPSLTSAAIFSSRQNLPLRPSSHTTFTRSSTQTTYYGEQLEDAIFSFSQSSSHFHERNEHNRQAHKHWQTRRFRWHTKGGEGMPTSSLANSCDLYSQYFIPDLFSFLGMMHLTASYPSRAGDMP